MRVPLLNFGGGPGVPILNFQGDPGSRGTGPTFTPCSCKRVLRDFVLE